jgi:bacterioferritin-associated ferredoxin
MGKTRSIIKSKPKVYTIYGIENTVTKKWYIGITSTKVRRGQHFALLRRGEHHSIKLQGSFNKHGEPAFSWHILETHIPEKYASEKEEKWVALFDSFNNGYNMNEGGFNHTSSGKPCKWNGIEYRTIIAAAEANNISQSLMSLYQRKGYVSDNDVHDNRNKSCIWNGVEYSTIREAAKANGVSETTMAARLGKGYCCDEDISLTNKPIPVTWNGVEYKSVKEAARALGIKNTTLMDRVRRGYTCDNDLTYNLKQCIWNGVEYPSISAAARELNMPVATLQRRIALGYVCDSDLKPSGIQKKPVTVNGIQYATVDDAAEALGLAVKTIRKRVAKEKLRQK